MSDTIDPMLLLPDGTPFALWADETEYTRIYFVDQHHPQAHDDNPGTQVLPLKTINRAAQAVLPGEKVVVKSGVYREIVIPARGGTGPDAMISYEAAPGADVVVKGSQFLPAAWELSRDPYGEDYSYRLWQLDLPDALFPSPENPFETLNATNADIDVMPWALRWKDRIPYTLPSGIIFQDGRRMVQLATYEDLVRLPGSYWVDMEEQRVHIHPFDRAKPNECTFEATVQIHLFAPQTIGLGYIRVSGFTFEHAGNPFPRVGVGAVYVKGGHHWIIEDNTVRHCNSVGIEAGARTNEHQVSTPEEDARVRAHVGGFLIRNNTVYDCGTGGIEGHTVRHTLIEGNKISQIGWQDVERYWECAAIKTLLNEHTLVRRNRIRDVESASAIWLDWDNRNCRVTQNTITDVRDASNGAVFIEASQVANSIDHNLIWGAWIAAVTLFDTDRTAVEHNLIAYSNMPVQSRVNTDRMLNGVLLSSKDNVIRNNLFFRNTQPLLVENPENVVNANVYVESGRAFGNDTWDRDSIGMPLMLDWCADTGTLTLELDSPLPEVERGASSACDFVGALAATTGVTPGPLHICGTGKLVFKL